MENHLLIGLGGTGGRVLAAYRKLIFERYGNLKPEGVWIDYLYVDSSTSDLKMDNPNQWEIMGQSVKLPNDSVVEIKAANLSTYVNNRSRFKYLAPWLGDSSDWTNIINDPKIADGAAGQKRRLGRLLFANGAPDFIKRVDAKVSNLRTNPEGNKTTIHVICGLAGGTGSGSVVDTIAQLRNLYPNPADARIILYLLLPDEFPNKEWASTDNYQPNGYAALKELNALDFQEFKPWNIGEREYDVERMNLSLPFYSAYLITEQNKENVSFDVQKVVPNSIAEFLFQKTLAVELAKQTESQTESPREFFDRAERGENPKYTDYDQKHSMKFMTYGIKRLAIPEQEIKEYYGYSFSDQAVLAMLYNNFVSEQGFVNEAKSDKDYASIISKRETKQKWNITREHLCLSLPILEEHKKENWKSINDEFKVIDKIKSKVLSDDNLAFDDKLVAIENKARAFYKKQFRAEKEEGQNGVENFYAYKLKHGIDKIVDSISTQIEEDLFNQWKTGTSLKDVEGTLNALYENLGEEVGILNGLHSSAQVEIKNLGRKEEIALKEWANTGGLSKMAHRIGLGRDIDTKVAEFTDVVKKKYSLMTWCHGYVFAKELINRLLQSLDMIKSNLSHVILNFMEAEKKLHNEYLSRCKDESEENQNRDGMVIKQYDSQKVRSVCSRANAVESVNEEHVRAMRLALVSLISSEKHSFKDVKEKLTIANILENAAIAGNEMATQFFNTPEMSDKVIGYERFIGCNIIEKLYDEFDGNLVGMKRKFEKLVKHAAVMAKPNPSEINDGGQSIREYTFVIIPDYKGNEEFQKQVINAIKEASTATNLKVSVGGRSNEIVVINLESNITPRYLASVEVLRRSYIKLFNSDKASVARFETQLEDYGDLTDLYKEDDATKAKRELEEKNALEAKGLPILLFAKSMGILKIQEDSETGRKLLHFIPEDEDGLPDFDNAIVLGSSLEKSLSKLTDKAIIILEKAVNNKICSDYKHVDKLADLRKLIATEVKSVMDAHNNSVGDPIVAKFNKAFKVVKEKIEELNEE